jgi:Helicase HerA, central domain
MTDAGLAAFRSVDFGWVQQLKSIWSDPPYHVPALHQPIIDDVSDYFARSTRAPELSNEPLGRIIVGPAGLGKTHLMGQLRRRVWDGDGYFVLLDLVGITDFWRSVALGFLNSLQVRTSDGRRQYDILILKIATALALEPQLLDIVSRLRNRPAEIIRELVQLFVNSLANRHRTETLEHQDVIRALVLLMSDDLQYASVAHGWLQGMDLDPADLRMHGFKPAARTAIDIVRGLSWVMSLTGPTLIAVDQIDSIVTAANIRNRATNGGAREEQREAKVIIDALAEGLMDLHEVKRRAVTVVSCLEATWKVLEERATVAITARYKAPTILYEISSGEMARALVSARTQQAYAVCGFQALYETWPFASTAFETAIGFTPRQLLKACEDHLQACAAIGKVFECQSFRGTVAPVPAPAPPGVDELFVGELKAADIRSLLDQANEDRLRDLFADVLSLYVKHLILPDDVDVGVQLDPDQKRPSLHGRLTFIFRGEGDREQHFCFRVLAHSNAIAFQSRLRAAMTASGVDHALRFRHLFILRRDDPPGGAKTKELVAKFYQADGKFIAPTEEDLRTFVALRAMLHRKLDGFDAWLQQRKPLFDTPLFKAAGLCPPSFLPQSPSPSGSGPGPPSPPSQPAKIPATAAPERQNGDDQASKLGHPESKLQRPHSERKAVSRDIPLGHRFERGVAGAAVTLPADLLPRHVAILAGAGSGKTVLLRRIVEEAALLGLPAIVLDTNNDLARLGDAWPQHPEGWTDTDAAKANHFQHSAEVVIWTPGINSGRPMSLALLPDFAALGDDPDEHDQAIEMARATLLPFIGATGAGGKLKQGVLADALSRFSRASSGGLLGLIQLLSDLPDDVSQIGNAPKLAAAIADQLRATVATDRLMRSPGVNLDPQSLFHGPTDRTRISVINFSGLADDEGRQSFVNQLQMSLFTWIKRKPSPTGRLYVLDEAQNFAPSQKSTPCKESTVSLAAQARKYGLGMIFATQTPKGIDNKIVSNCTTHFYGRMSAPATIEAIRELMAAKGGTADDIGRLSRGEFYFSTEATPRPIKIRTPLCLSWHPPNPLTAGEVVARARGGRADL